MIKAVALCLTMLVSLSAQAKEISSSQLSITPSAIDQVIRLVDKDDAGSSYKKLSIIVTDGGMSTDVSPRFTIYLGYASLAEMGNISADFLISNQAFSFISASRKSAGIYVVKFQEFRDDGMYEVTQTLDTTPMFIEEKKIRKACGADFCDTVLKTKITVSETAKKMW